MTAPYCVCIPARDEAERLPRLLGALAEQDIAGPIPIALCINNSTDGSADIARKIGARLRYRIDLSIEEVCFPPKMAHAGAARRRAMEMGAARTSGDPNCALLSTDADCRPPPSWIGANLTALAERADIIGGRIVIDPEETLPDGVAETRSLWDNYWVQVRAIEDAIDPRSWDPEPRHGDHTGASLALRTALYRATGGVPLLPFGEDRALVEAAVMAGGRLAHPASVWTYVSPRQQGRAEGGMASDMRRLHAGAAGGSAPMAPAFVHWQARAAWRRGLRATSDGDRRIPREERALPPMPHDMPLVGGAR